MKKIDGEDKFYTLIAVEGKDLALKDPEGNIVNRTKEVRVNTKKTLNIWVEVDELPSESEVVVDPIQKEIANLEARLAQLKAEVQAQ